MIMSEQTPPRVVRHIPKIKKVRFTRLKKILMDKGISQKDLSKMSDVPEYKISQLCSGKVSNIYLNTAKKICEVLECSLDDAFGDLIH